MLLRKFTYILFLFSLIGFVGFSYVSKRAPVTACNQWGFSSKAEKYYAQPEKIVVKPWLGRHHVYGIFQIPGGYLNDKLLKVEIPGGGTHCGILTYGGTVTIDGVYAKPGHYLMKGFLNTRIALKLILQGKQAELKQWDNWKLGYTKIENISKDKG